MDKLHSCQYWACNNTAEFNQPDSETGELIEVCKQHFVLNRPS